MRRFDKCLNLLQKANTVGFLILIRLVYVGAGITLAGDKTDMAICLGLGAAAGEFIFSKVTKKK